MIHFKSLLTLCIIAFACPPSKGSIVVVVPPPISPTFNLTTIATPAEGGSLSQGAVAHLGTQNIQAWPNDGWFVKGVVVEPAQALERWYRFRWWRQASLPDVEGGHPCRPEKP